MNHVPLPPAQLHAQIHARAGLVATEFSLLGLGAATLIVTLLVALLPEFGGPQLVRPSLAVSAGLLGCGTAISVVGRSLDLGGTRQNQTMRWLWWPLLALSVLGALGGWQALHQVGLLATMPDRHGWPPALLALSVGLAVVCVLLLAVLGLRALAAVHAGAPAPVWQLWQAMTHTLLAAVAMVALVGITADVLTREMHAFLGTAICVMAGHAVVAGTWLLRSSRRRLAVLRAAKVHAHMLERGHTLGSMALLLGLVAPGLLVLANLLVAKDIALAPACAVLAVSNHAMRYAWVLLPLRTNV